MKSYFKVGLNMMVSGTPWWNCDIGGFITEDNTSDMFQELMVRWYQWGVFMPIFRTHGDRENNEPWTVGGYTYPYLRAQILLREALRPYVMTQMDIASETGLPPIRPLFFDYQQDENTYAVADQLLFGGDILAAPVLDYKCGNGRCIYRVMSSGSMHTTGISTTVYRRSAPRLRLAIFRYLFVPTARNGKNCKAFS